MFTQVQQLLPPCYRVSSRANLQAVTSRRQSLCSVEGVRVSLQNTRSEYPAVSRTIPINKALPSPFLWGNLPSRVI